MKPCGGMEVQLHALVSSTLDEMSGQFHDLAALPPWKVTSPYPLDMRLGGPQSRSGNLPEN